MATLNELIAQLNMSTDNILSDANKLNLTADNMNQTLDNMGVQEVSGIAGVAPDIVQDDYRTTLMETFDPSQLTGGASYVMPPNLGTAPIVDQQKNKGIMSQVADLAKNYIMGGGAFGLGAKFIGGILGAEMDPKQKALRAYYGYDNIGKVPQGQLMAGYNPVSGGLLNLLTGGMFGQPTTYGLQNAYQKRIDTIKNTLAKKYADGDYSGTLLDERLKALQDAKIQESMMLDQVNQDTAFKNEIGDTYSGGETTTNVGGQNITTYEDPFDIGGGE